MLTILDYHGSVVPCTLVWEMKCVEAPRKHHPTIHLQPSSQWPPTLHPGSSASSFHIRRKLPHVQSFVGYSLFQRIACPAKIKCCYCFPMFNCYQQDLTPSRALLNFQDMFYIFELLWILKAVFGESTTPPVEWGCTGILVNSH